MKKEIAEKWVEALRSGKYKQAKGTLREYIGDERNCCLGVLCDISGLGKWDKFFYKENDRDHSAGEILSEKIMSWAGLQKSMPSIEGILLSSMNDQGKSFLQIADIIEQNWEVL